MLVLCVLLELDGVVQNNFSGNIHTLNVTSSSSTYYFYCHLVLEARWRWYSGDSDNVDGDMARGGNNNNNNKTLRQTRTMWSRGGGTDWNGMGQSGGAETQVSDILYELVVCA